MRVNGAAVDFAWTITGSLASSLVTTTTKLEALGVRTSEMQNFVTQLTPGSGVLTDLNGNRAVAGVGAAGSILAFVSFVCRAASGDISYALLPASCIDLAFGLLMLQFMVRTSRQKGIPRSA